LRFGIVRGAKPSHISRRLAMSRILCSVLLVVAIVGCSQSTDPTGPHPSALGIGASPPYEFIDLGTLGGQHSHAMDINDDGQVIGWAYDVTGARRAFLWEDGVMRDLGTLGGTYFTTADDINDNGQVAGHSSDATGMLRPFLWSDGVMHDLDPGGQVPFYGPPLRVNNSGWVVWTGQVGNDIMGSPLTRAFLWRDGASTELATFGGTGASSAYAINDRGQVVGTSNGHAVLWDQGAVQDLGSGLARDINSRGQIAGTSGKHAFFWDAGQTTEIGPLPGDSWSSAVVINTVGQVAGVSVMSSPATGIDRIHSFRWQLGMLQPVSPNYESEPNHRLFGMNLRGLAVGERASKPVAWEEGVTWDLPGSVPGGLSGGRGQAFAVNARGDIVGWVGTPTGEHAALWRRIPAVAVLPSPLPSR
jgi:probable HAF family extracellular repeat protein